MSITGTIAAVITLIASDFTNIPGAIAAYSIGPGIGDEVLSNGSFWSNDDDS